MIAAPDLSPCLMPGICPSSLSDLGGSIASAAAGAALDAVGTAMSTAADWLVGHVMDLIDNAATPHLDARWFREELQVMETVAALVLAPVLMAASIGPALRQDGRRLARIWGVGLPVAVLAGAVGSQVAQLGLSVTDFLCEVVQHGQPNGMARHFSDIMGSSLVSGAPMFVNTAVAAITIVGTVMVWLEMLVRAAAVYVATFFMPLALVGFVWPATVQAARRVAEILVSLILSKLVVMASLTLGLSALSKGADAPVAGAGILLMAGFAPFTLMRLAPVVEAAAIAHLEGLSRRPVQAAARVAAAPAHPVAQMALNRLSQSRTGPGSPSPVTRLRIPEHPPDYPDRPSGSRGGESARA